MYHLQRDGQQFGPYGLADLQAYVAQGAVLPTDFAWTEGMTEWVTVEQVLASHIAPIAVAPASAAPVESQPRYYTPSGKIDGKALALVPGLSVLVALVLGAAYGYITRYNPLIYIQFLVTIGFGFGMGLAVAYAGKIGGARSKILLIGAGLLAGLLAEYSGWVFYVLAEGKEFMLGPGSLVSKIKDHAEDGLWQVKNWKPKGGVLYAIWGLEGIVIVGGTVIVSLRGNTAPYCETCKRWQEEPVALWPFHPIEDQSTFIAALERGDYSPILQLPRATPQATAYTRFALLQCPGCEQGHYLTVESVQIEVDKKNNTEEKVETVLENLIIDPATFQALEAKQTQHPVSPA